MVVGLKSMQIGRGRGKREEGRGREIRSFLSGEEDVGLLTEE
jgi:hypothetical protein